eukprot:scaffold114_cov361-Pinguiococcus_pyrenoidosus.AAC.28
MRSCRRASAAWGSRCSSCPRPCVSSAAPRDKAIPGRRCSHPGATSGRTQCWQRLAMSLAAGPSSVLALSSTPARESSWYAGFARRPGASSPSGCRCRSMRSHPKGTCLRPGEGPPRETSPEDQAKAPGRPQSSLLSCDGRPVPRRRSPRRT